MTDTAGHSASEKVPTTYVVLAQDGVAVPVDQPSMTPNQKVWRHVGEYVARSGAAAILEHAKKATANAKQTDPVLVLVAVPARSWSPVTVRTKVETTLLIEDVS